MRENNLSLHFETLQLHAEQPLGISTLSIPLIPWRKLAARYIKKLEVLK